MHISNLIEKYTNKKEDTVTLDIPLLIRLFEYSREDAKSDLDLHIVAKNMLKHNKILTIYDYDDIVDTSKK